jgi:hypothetical protein
MGALLGVWGSGVIDYGNYFVVRLSFHRSSGCHASDNGAGPAKCRTSKRPSQSTSETQALASWHERPAAEQGVRYGH